jgi:arylsulfatase A-like enzyme
MSFFTTSRKSHRKHSARTPSWSQISCQSNQANWIADHELALVYCLMDLIREVVRPPFGNHYNTITKDLNSRIQDGSYYNKQQVTKKVEQLRQNYKDFTELLSGNIATGVGWDDVTNTVSLHECQ